MTPKSPRASDVASGADSTQVRILTRLRSPSPMEDPSAATGRLSSRSVIHLRPAPFDQVAPVVSEALLAAGFPPANWVLPSEAQPTSTPPGRFAYCTAERRLRLDPRNAGLLDALTVLVVASLAITVAVGLFLYLRSSPLASDLWLVSFGLIIVYLVAAISLPPQFRSEMAYVELQGGAADHWPPQPEGLFGRPVHPWPPMPAIARVDLNVGEALTENIGSRTAPPGRIFVKGLEGGSSAPVVAVLTQRLAEEFRVPPDSRP